MAALKSLINEKHDYESVVIDSLDWLERLVWDKLCQQYGVESIEKVDGGYARGYMHALSSPNDWKVDRLKDCLDSIVGGDWGDEPGSDVDGRDLVVLRVADFEQGSVKTEDLTVRAIKQSKIPHRLVTPRSLLIEKSGGGEKQWVGRVVYPGELSFESICSNFIAKVELSRKYDARFFNYLFSTLYDSEANRLHVRQTTGIQNLAVEHYLNTKVSLPLLPEQQRIADYLDASCEAIDRAVETKQKQLDTLDALRKSIIGKAITQGLDPNVLMKDSGEAWLGHVPKHWTRHRIKDICKISPSYSTGKPDDTELCTVVPMESVSTRGEVDVDQACEFRDVNTGLNLFENGDVIFAKITPCMENGKGAYVTNLPTQFAFGSTEFHVMRPQTHRIDGQFLYFYTQNKVFRDWAEKNMHGAAGQQRVGTNFLKYTLIYLPSITEQRSICDFVVHRIHDTRGVSQNISRQIKTLIAYRKSLVLNQAFT